MNEYLTVAKEIAKEASEIAVKYFSFDIQETWKDNDTPLTQADTEINELVIRKINEHFPEHSILGEEASATKLNSKYTWVCDPIDGTMAYSCGLPMFTFSLALVDQSTGQPVLGIIDDPIMKNTYWAIKGEGTYRNGKKINVVQSTTLKNTYMNLGGGSVLDAEQMKEQALSLLRKGGARSFILPSIIYGAIQVANGKFGGAIFFGKYAHDVAALKIITEEAGGKVTDLKGNERRYDEEGLGCVISNGLLHEEILSCIQ